MAISPAVAWFMIGLTCVGLEIMSGTLFLLAPALAAFCSGVAAAMGLSLTAQGMCAGFITLFAACGFYFLKRSRHNADAGDCLDIGQAVTVSEIDHDGRAVVVYRGARWLARAEQGRLTPGVHTITAISGTQLILRAKSD